MKALERVITTASPRQLAPAARATMSAIGLLWEAAARCDEP